MQYRNLGNSDLKVSRICLGSMTFGEQNNEQEAFEQLDYAWQQGVNFLDTRTTSPILKTRFQRVTKGKDYFE